MAPEYVEAQQKISRHREIAIGFKSDVVCSRAAAARGSNSNVGIGLGFAARQTDRQRFTTEKTVQNKNINKPLPTRCCVPQTGPATKINEQFLNPSFERYETEIQCSERL